MTRADDSRVDAGGGERCPRGRRMPGSDRSQQPARGLRDRGTGHEIGSRPPRHRQAGRRSARDWSVPPPGTLPATSDRQPSSKRDRRRRRSRACSRSPRPSRDAWPTSPKPVMSVQACTAPAGSARSASQAARFRVDHRSHRPPSTAASGARPNFSAVAMIPVPSGLVRNSTSPGCAPAFARSDAGCDLAGHGVAELDLLILDGVAAEQRDARLAQRVEAAGKNLPRAPPRRHPSGSRRSRARSAAGRPSHRHR